MKKRLKLYGGRAFVFSVGILLPIVVLEILLRLQIVVPHVFDNDGWWKFRWHTEKKTFNNTPTEFPDQFDPVLGWVPKNNFQTTNEFGSLSFNSIGARSKQEYQTLKQGKKRIVTIGDSFTYGECVGDEETYSAYLEKELTNTEVLNFGVHGYGLDQQLLRLKSALTFLPDVVIVGFYNPDTSRILLSFREYHKPIFALINGKTEITNVPLPSPDIYSRQAHFLTFDVLYMYFYELRNRIFPEQKYLYETSLATAILEEMGNITTKTGSELYLLYLPSFEEVNNNVSSPHKSYTTICNEKKALCIDPTEALHNFILSSSDPSHLFRCHYAKEVHEVLAREIKKYLEI